MKERPPLYGSGAPIFLVTHLISFAVHKTPVVKTVQTTLGKSWRAGVASAWKQALDTCLLIVETARLHLAQLVFYF